MQNLTLKWRVLLVIAAVHLLVMLGASYVLLENARTAVAREITAAQESAAILIREFVGQRSDNAAAFADELRAVIVPPRHVRIRYVPSIGESSVDLSVAQAEGVEEDAPDWFLHWVSPKIDPISIHVGPSAMRPLGAVEIIASAGDEAAEVWEDVEALFLVWSSATVILLIALTVLVGRALAPLKRLERSLSRLSAGDYTGRAGATRSPDLLPIGLQIDTLAASLQTSEAARKALAARLLELREEERRVLARELHDELGPCLFGLSVMADGLRNAPGTAVRRADEIDMLVARIRNANRRILNTLRPATIGNLPLRDVVTDLVAEMADANPDVRFRVDISDDLPVTSDLVDATVYRILQEAMTNALRHGLATQICVDLRHDMDTGLKLEIHDNGRGPGKDWKEGRGLLGMRERLEALEGSLSLTSCENHQGATLRTTIPQRD